MSEQRADDVNESDAGTPGKARVPWVRATRPQFLLLAIVLVLHGTALALWQDEGAFDWLRFVLAMTGLVLLHASVNVLNDWHDWSRSGIDKMTKRAPFSGGGGMLPAARMTEQQVLALGIGTLLAGSAIGVYLAAQAGWELLVIGAVGVVSIVAYTPLFNRIALGEIVAGFALGTLPVVGTYFLLTGRLDQIAWVSGVPAGLLTYNLLLLNEFPDTEADAAGGRRHMVILLGKRGAAWLYAAVELAAYAFIVAGVFDDGLTRWALLGLISLPFAIKAIAGAFQHYDGFEELFPAQGANVGAVLSTNVLLAIGYVVAAIA